MYEDLEGFESLEGLEEERCTCNVTYEDYWHVGRYVMYFVGGSVAISTIMMILKIYNVI